MTTVTQLWIYPVKGLQGIELEQAQLTQTGLAYDRHWMVVDPSGRFVTQRQLPQMATIHTSINDKELLLSHTSQQQPLRIPLTMEQPEQTEVRVWDSELSATVELEAGVWLTAALSSAQPLRLVRFDPQQRRPVSPKHLQQQEQSSTHFADGFPLLLCNQQTLIQLNQALLGKGEQAVPMSRFRGNIIVDECGGAMAELANITLTADTVTFATRKPCQRCPVTRIDQNSGERMHKQEPIPTLIALNPMADKPGPYFGGNAIVLNSGLIRVGDRLRLS